MFITYYYIQYNNCLLVHEMNVLPTLKAQRSSFLQNVSVCFCRCCCSHFHRKLFSIFIFTRTNGSVHTKLYTMSDVAIFDLFHLCCINFYMYFITFIWILSFFIWIVWFSLVSYIFHLYSLIFICIIQILFVLYNFHCIVIFHLCYILRIFFCFHEKGLMG